MVQNGGSRLNEEFEFLLLRELEAVSCVREGERMSRAVIFSTESIRGPHLQLQPLSGYMFVLLFGKA